MSLFDCNNVYRYPISVLYVPIIVLRPHSTAAKADVQYSAILFFVFFIFFTETFFFLLFTASRLLLQVPRQVMITICRIECFCRRQLTRRCCRRCADVCELVHRAECDI